MEKLLNLINEYHYANSEACKYLYDDESKKIYFRTTLEDGDIDDEWIDDERIISKRFGFIEWLVDNDKIDTHRIKLFNITEYRDKQDGYIAHGVTICDSLLMLLAISDTPIDDLISYLK